MLKSRLRGAWKSEKSKSGLIDPPETLNNGAIDYCNLVRVESMCSPDGIMNDLRVAGNRERTVPEDFGNEIINVCLQVFRKISHPPQPKVFNLLYLPASGG